MLKFIADENFNGRIVRGILQRNRNVDILRVQDTDYAEAEDLPILEFAAKQNRIVLTHDAATMIGFAYERLTNKLPMPGMIIASMGISIGVAVEDILLITECYSPEEIKNQVIYIPL